MKRICKIIYVAFFILFIPLSMALGQDNKREQKIRIIKDDGSGTKVIIDTVFKNGTCPDSIKLKDGTFISLKHPGDDKVFRHHSGKDRICMIASTKSDSDSCKSKGCQKYKVITRSSKEDGDREEIVYINKDKNPEKVIEKTFDISVSDNGEESNDQKISYVIAKDGIVVTIEGNDNDEARLKELVNDIQNKLGVKSETKVKKETVKGQSEKTINE